MRPEVDGTGREAERITLREGVHALGLCLSNAQLFRIEKYLEMLQRWNRVYNLTAVRDPQDMLQQHVLDTLAILPPLLERGLLRLAERCPSVEGRVIEPGPATAPMARTRTRLADLGSGAGLPGLILAIACSELHLMSIEPVGKKCAFQQQVVSELGLTDVEIVQKRAEQVQVKVDIIISRALTSLSDLIQISSGLTGEGVSLLAMKGRQQELDAELLALPPAWSAEVLPIRVPGLQAERHLVLLNRP